ncbi:MAG: hypothetical protein E3K37_17810 [Candidatus Kuenenia sp.]|nr:hypothetical protein [Candidatus Kuenenia hertensis]
MQRLLEEENTPGISNAFEQDAKYLTFELSGEEYGVDVLKVKEIISMAEITPVPKTPKYVKGIINLRGKIIPVIDLRLKLGVRETEPAKYLCIIIVETHKDLKGIIVDMVSEVLVVSANDMEPSPQFKSGIDADFFLGIAKIKGKLKLLLDIDNVLGTDRQHTSLEKKNQANERKKDLCSTNNDDTDLEENNSLKSETDKENEAIDLNAIAENIANDIKESTTSLFETMIMMEMKFKEYSLIDETKIKSDVVCMISFTGKYHGIVSLFCSKELALQIASNMLMEEQSTLTTEVKDAVGEILNMIAGNVKTKIAEKYGETYLSIPLVIAGEDISVSVTETQETPYKTTVVCFTKDPWITTSFSCNNDIMTVGLMLKKTIW